MPIPQLQSSFSRRKIGEDRATFSHHPLSSGASSSNQGNTRSFFSFGRKKTDRPRGGCWFKRLLPILLVLIFLGGIFLIGAFAWYSRDLPDPYKIKDRSIAQTTKFYDQSGQTLLYELHGQESRTLVSINDIPKNVVNATIAIEDKNFYNHGGISLWGILRGQIVPRLRGQRAQGGSTLTQQFVKNAILTNERTLPRKIKEWILSYQIEKKFSKQEILQLYFNEIPYGGLVYGVEAAARYYFDKPVKDLTLAEAAILAALPQSPTTYSPYGNHKDRLISRQHTILDLMVEQDYVTRDEAEAAKTQELKFKKRAEQIRAPHFVMYVKELLGQKYGDTMVETSGWKIITTLNWEAQQKAEQIINEQAPANLEKYGANNAALVSIDVPSGDIVAMVGSKDYFDDSIDGQVNVTLAPRQPGSSMKPFVYLAAFIKGYRPETMLFDLVTNFAAAGDPYIPHNYDLKERGPVSMRQALAGSLNIPAVKTIYLAGINNVLDLAEKFGYTTLKDRSRYGLSLVLGGAEVKLLEHTNAYAALAREGIYQEPVAVLKIEDSSSKIIEENQESPGLRVADRKFVRILNGILSDNPARAFIFGESNYLALGDRPVAAKTGTTNDYHDAWTMGFTPDKVTGVWVGNNDNTAMKKGADGSILAAPIWNKFMQEITKNDPVKQFPIETLESCDKPMLCGKLGDEKIVKIDKMSGKLATQYTPYDQIEERKIMEVHDILQYVNINDPSGEPLDNPADDPQYNLWEKPVKKWAEENGYTAQEIPTATDDIHLPELQPSISWQSPSDNSTIRSAGVFLQVQATAPRGVSRVEFFLDEQKIGQSTNQPYSLNYQVNPFLTSGRHQLRAIAFDDQGNFKEAGLTIDLQLDQAAKNFNITWLQPNNGDTVNTSNLPIKLKLNIDKPQNIKKIDFYYLRPDNNSEWFAYRENPSSNNLELDWGQGLLSGVYKLYLVIKDQGDNVITSPAIILNVQ
ncbi:MAG: hypothetical protein C3F02_01990 [Parcubacteria group bacterium]|nr:MAG: hypothetical protein C3F02_01990 [Parcubacteria group bacterium]